MAVRVAVGGAYAAVVPAVRARVLWLAHRWPRQASGRCGPAGGSSRARLRRQGFQAVPDFLCSGPAFCGSDDTCSVGECVWFFRRRKCDVDHRARRHVGGVHARRAPKRPIAAAAFMRGERRRIDVSGAAPPRHNGPSTGLRGLRPECLSPRDGLWSAGSCPAVRGPRRSGGRSPASSAPSSERLQCGGVPVQAGAGSSAHAGGHHPRSRTAAVRERLELKRLCLAQRPWAASASRHGRHGEG